MKFCIATNQTIRKEVNKKKETHSANNLTKKKKKTRKKKQKVIINKKKKKKKKEMGNMSSAQLLNQNRLLTKALNFSITSKNFKLRYSFYLGFSKGS